MPVVLVYVGSQSVSQSLFFKIAKIENCLHLSLSDGSASRVDISPVVSSYQHHITGERSHLHPKLVDKSGEMSTDLSLIVARLRRL